MAKQSLRVLVLNHWKTSSDPLLKVLAANDGDLVPALEAVRGQIAVEEGQATGIWLRDTRVTDAGLEPLAGLVHVTEFETSEYMTDAGLVHLRNMTAMKRLMLLKTKVTGDGLKHLAGMTNLGQLQLFSGTATDDALSHLPALPALTSLSLNSSSGFTDAALEHIARLPQLVSLSLCDAPIRGPGLQYLTHLRALENLDLGGAREEYRFPAGGLSHLPELPRVDCLYLRHTYVTDDDLQHLARLPKLEHLNLEMTCITDVGVRHLAALRKLQSVNLDHSKVTIRGVQELKAARPKVSVSARNCTPPPDEPQQEEKLDLIVCPEHRKAAPVAKSWARIEKWMAQHLPAALGTLRPPAKESDLDELEKRIGRPLPPDFRESYLIHDGQNWEEETAGMGVLFGMHLAPIAESDGVLWLYEHRVEHEWPEKDNYMLGWVFYPPDAMRETWSGPGWVPFFWDSGRNFLGIDLDPGPNGVVGQVIPFGTDDEFRPVIALSFGHLLEDIADELEAGHAAVAPPEVTHSPFWLKGAPRNYFANCYRPWAEAKLPERFKQVEAVARFVPEDHATPITGDLADQLVALLREFLTEMNEYERRWLAVRPIREYGVSFISEAGPNGGNNWSMDGPSPGEKPRNAVQAVLWDPDAKHDEKAEALGIGKHWKDAIAEKAKIWKRFLTSEERPTARAFTQSDPPRYNPRALIKPEVKRVTPEHAIIEFGQPKPPNTCGVGRLRYHLRVQGGRWRIERHEAIDDPKKPWKLDFS